jgi:Cof subfamily protein (haloacid dehalogenase superfamily)
MIHLVGIDVDGTLVGKSGKVDPRVWEAAELARAKGIRLALCSGRPAFGLAVEFARRLDPKGWHIFQNGASVVNLATGESRSSPLPDTAVQTFTAEARASDRILELYSDNDWVVESTAPWAMDHAKLLGVDFKHRKFESLQGAPVRAQWLLTSTQAKEIMARPHPGLEVAESTSPLMPDTRFVGFTHEGVSKASALLVVSSAYGISISDVMYIGDSGNDLSALRVVGHPIAMGNSDPAVIAVAERTVATADNAGVAEALHLAIASV